ncbi:glutathione S-transferase family protein [Neptuniibacter sp.]|uniref:glutathione S-transferase family protein n=1 Tax=Neptuniibacter sp. TaxID=1962643 RepID=UPI002613FA13|nr:glutathione S-transferase family protein [Neptuniibacter sp.]MCP4596919.1 glutathione S-transferase family protein [Neptuniibacter sp.]
MIKVVSFKICPFVQRITALLEAKHIPYEIEYISLRDKPNWFLEISPHGQVPVLITESGQPLFESDAIAEYIEDAYAPLQKSVSAEQRAINRAWSYLASKNYLVQCSVQRSSDLATLKERANKLAKAFAAIEGVLGDSRYFNSQSIGMVDIAWLPLLHRAAIIEKHRCYDFLADYPKLKNWQQNLLSTGLAERSVSDDFESRFTEFYLSEETFLGKGSDVCSSQADQACITASCC